MSSPVFRKMRYSKKGVLIHLVRVRWLESCLCRKGKFGDAIIELRGRLLLLSIVCFDKGVLAGLIFRCRTSYILTSRFLMLGTGWRGHFILIVYLRQGIITWLLCLNRLLCISISFLLWQLSIKLMRSEASVMIRCRRLCFCNSQVLLSMSYAFSKDHLLLGSISWMSHHRLLWWRSQRLLIPFNLLMTRWK